MSEHSPEPWTGLGFDPACVAKQPRSMMWRRFWFESNLFFGYIASMDDWRRLRLAYPEMDDEKLLDAKEATYRGTVSQKERDARPNYGLRQEHDGERTLRDFFAEHSMSLEPNAEPSDQTEPTP